MTVKCQHDSKPEFPVAAATQPAMCLSITCVRFTQGIRGLMHGLDSLGTFLCWSSSGGGHRAVAAVDV